MPEAPSPGKKAAPVRSRGGRGGARTAAAPAAVVEDEAVETAVKRVRPSRSRPAAQAAAALRGDPDFGAGADGGGEEGDGSTGVMVVPEPENPVAVETDLAVEPVEFQGRLIRVTSPTSEQLTMYRRLAREFQDLGRDGNADRLGLDESLRQLDRATRLIQSVMKEPRDREWLEDQLLEGNVTLDQCTELLRSAFAQLHKANEAQQNRADRRRGSRARLADD